MAKATRKKAARKRSPADKSGIAALLPDWAREQYIALRASFPESDAVLNKLVASNEMSRAWESLRRRIPKFKDATAKLPFDEVTDPDALATLEDLASAYKDIGFVGDDAVLFDLWMTISTTLKFSDLMFKFSASETRDRLKKIAELSSKLSSQLKDADFCADASPPAFNRAASEVMHPIKGLVDQSTATGAGTAAHDELLAINITMAYVKDLPALLDAVAEASTKSAANLDELRMPARPHTPGARRLFFLKKMREYLEESYGSPLHETNLAIASAFFDCSELTAPKIATITSR